eukprot:gnl/TRDRNA2_/TRDRNA2_31838_c0_seq1.p1 gnl/TRDRNA2_/TRDRNA2_31838_c0~~gnl/TRDRNA2_/TRDRNA2_31838_c0_seq1.p1  ORF type:complete len:510 (+),score=84.68 gnl/TRDRNA2_/TRDRNA2_31838_c0_seq1:50-1579(+)
MSCSNTEQLLEETVTVDCEENGNHDIAVHGVADYLRNEAIKCRLEVESLHLREADLRAEAAACRHEVEELQRRVTSLAEENGSLRSENEALKVKVAGYEARLNNQQPGDEAANEIPRLRSAAAEAEARCGAHMREATQLRATLAACDAELCALRKAYVQVSVAVGDKTDRQNKECLAEAVARMDSACATVGSPLGANVGRVAMTEDTVAEDAEDTGNVATQTPPLAHTISSQQVIQSRANGASQVPGKAEAPQPQQSTPKEAAVWRTAPRGRALNSRYCGVKGPSPSIRAAQGGPSAGPTVPAAARVDVVQATPPPKEAPMSIAAASIAEKIARSYSSAMASSSAATRTVNFAVGASMAHSPRNSSPHGPRVTVVGPVARLRSSSPPIVRSTSADVQLSPRWVSGPDLVPQGSSLSAVAASVQRMQPQSSVPNLAARRSPSSDSRACMEASAVSFTLNKGGAAGAFSWQASHPSHVGKPSSWSAPVPVSYADKSSRFVAGLPSPAPKAR